MGILSERNGDLEVYMQGLPVSQMTQADTSNVALSLIKSMPLGMNVTAGVMGGIQRAALKIAGQKYEFEYSIVALRALKALEVYNNAIDFIDFLEYKNRVDSQLAEETKKFLREDFRLKNEKWLKKNKR